MAASSEPVKIEKRRLKNTPMYVNRIQETRASSFGCITVTIERFSLMERYTKYMNRVPVLDWSITIFLDNENLTLTFLHAEHNPTMQSFLKFEDRLLKPQNYFPVKKIDKGTYQSCIPLRSIVVKENTFLKRDYVKIIFEIDKDKRCITSLRPIIGVRTERSANKIHKDLKKALERNDGNDFAIVAQNEKVYFHKGIVASRSGLFRSEIYKKVENEGTTEFELDTKITTVKHLRDYMYTGALVPLALDDFIDAMKLSLALEIPNLHDMCLVGIHACMNRKNVGYVMNKAIESKLLKLLMLIDQLIDEDKNPNWNSDQLYSEQLD